MKQINTMQMKTLEEVSNLRKCIDIKMDEMLGDVRDFVSTRIEQSEQNIEEKFEMVLKQIQMLSD